MLADTTFRGTIFAPTDAAWQSYYSSGEESSTSSTSTSTNAAFTESLTTIEWCLAGAAEQTEDYGPEYQTNFLWQQLNMHVVPNNTVPRGQLKVNMVLDTLLQPLWDKYQMAQGDGLTVTQSSPRILIGERLFDTDANGNRVWASYGQVG